MKKFLLFSLLAIALFLGAFLVTFIVMELSKEVSAEVLYYSYIETYYEEEYTKEYTEEYTKEYIKKYIEEPSKTIYEDVANILYSITNLEGVSVWFENIETGFSVAYNENYVYFSASITKAPLALHVYRLALEGQIDLNDELTLTSADFRGGSGIIRYAYTAGNSLTIRRFIELNLYESDNTATAILMRYFGSSYRQFLASIGANHSMAHSGRLTDSGLTASEAAIFARAIHSFIEEGNTYSKELRQNLLNNRFPFITSSYPIATKTGWTYPLALHDMAIVYAPSPYILVILTQGRHRLYTDFYEFNKISYLFETFNNRWFSQ